MYGVRLISKDFEWNVPNVLRWSDLFYVRLFHYLKSKSINAMISIQICINKDAIANFFIVPPPPIVRKRWAQLTSVILLYFHYSIKYANRYLLSDIFIEIRQSIHKERRTSVEHLVAISLTKSNNTKNEQHVPEQT